MTDDDVSAEGLERLLEYLRATRGLDFTGYKRPSLSRRIRKRMSEVEVATFDDYHDFLEINPAEQVRLVETILINVTSFFRDEAAWACLSEDVVPAIIAAKGPDEPIRVWSAGCASGEEAYSLAMAFADQLGIDEFKERVKIFATDVDEQALATARAGVYDERTLEPLGVERRDRYFVPTSSGFEFRSDCRRSVIFGRNDITIDAPISRLDLLVCRNVLMYFVSETQRRVLQRFAFALRHGGYLFLGRAETILANSDLFEPVDLSQRVFVRSFVEGRRADLLGASYEQQEPGPGANTLQRLARAATPVAQLVVDIEGRLVEANSKARAMFSITGDDLGRPFSELEVSFRPVDLRAHIEQAYVEARPVALHDVARTLVGGDVQFLEVTIAPLTDPGGTDLGASLTFADTTELGRLRVDLETSSRSLALANERLVRANEELETSNEELQSTNEELETTNEELQSANEELETMNEELQSGNEELETMNEELLSQTRQIERGERFMASILDSLVVGLAVVDRHLDVVVWNRAVENLFGIRSEEAVDRSFLALDIGLPVGDIGPLVRAVLADSDPQETVVDAVDRRGRPFRCRVHVQRLLGLSDDRDDVVITMNPLVAVDHG